MRLSSTHIRRPSRAEPAFCSVVTDNFVVGFICMERTLRKTNPELDFPIYVVTSERAPLSAASRDLIRAHCRNVYFHEASNAPLDPVYRYAARVIGTPERLLPAFSILSAFELRMHERVVCLDSDMLICGSLAELFEVDVRFAAVRARDTQTNAPMNFINTGVMVLGSEYLHGFDLAEAIARIGDRPPRPGTGKADQAIINLLFPNEIIHYLPARFNYTKRMLRHEMEPPLENPDDVASHLHRNDIRVLHFVGEKPWNPKVRQVETSYQAAEELWREALADIGSPALFQHMDKLNRLWHQRYIEASRLLLKNYSQRRRTPSNTQIEREFARAMGL